MQVLAHLHLELAAVQAHGHGAVGAAQHRGHRGAGRAGARRHGLPHPALEDARADRGVALPAPERDVRAVREQLVVLDRRAQLGQVELLELVVDLDRALRVADRHELEVESSRPADSRVPRPSSPPDGKSGSRQLRAAHVDRAGRGSPVMRGRTSPAAVEIENVSESVQPLRRRYITASRTPLPDSSASDPSGLKIRSVGHEAALLGRRDSSSTPSAPTPVCGAQSARTRSGVSSNGSCASSTIA